MSPLPTERGTMTNAEVRELMDQAGRVVIDPLIQAKRRAEARVVELEAVLQNVYNDIRSMEGYVSMPVSREVTKVLAK